MRFVTLVPVLFAAWLAGCAGAPTRSSPISVFPDMDQQPKYRPQSRNAFFADGRTARRPVAGTVARGQLNEDDAFATGVVNNMYVPKNPLPITREVMLRGQQRFNIYCSPCHDRTGRGQGIVPRRTPGWQAGDLHDPRLKNYPDGEIFNIMSFGRRSMPAYRFQIPTEDRWAIVAYVRALQRTTLAKIDDIPAEERGSLR